MIKTIEELNSAFGCVEAPVNAELVENKVLCYDTGDLGEDQGRAEPFPKEGA